MKKVIMFGLLERVIESDVTGKAFELYQVEEYIDEPEVFQDYEDPIIECWENDILNHGGDFDGFEWDLNTDCSINTRDFSIGKENHILYFNGEPHSIYWIEEK